MTLTSRANPRRVRRTDKNYEKTPAQDSSTTEHHEYGKTYARTEDAAADASSTPGPA